MYFNVAEVIYASHSLDMIMAESIASSSQKPFKVQFVQTYVHCPFRFTLTSSN